MASFELEVDEIRTKRQLDLLSRLFYDEDILIEINRIIGETLNPYVPLGDASREPTHPGYTPGKLRRSMTPTVEGVIWGNGEDADASDYAGYQHDGFVWKINFPIHEKGNPHKIIGWRSRPMKYPTFERIGSLSPDAVKDGWHFGYSTENTTADWEYAYNYGVKADAQLAITRMLYNECKERGLL